MYINFILQKAHKVTLPTELTQFSYQPRSPQVLDLAVYC